MPEFRYQAIDKRGRSLNGNMLAHDETDLQKKLKDLGLWLTESVRRQSAGSIVVEADTQVNRLRLRGKKGRRELIDFCTVLTVQVREGVPLVQALQAAREDCRDPQFREVLGKLQTYMESGMEFHEALARYPGVFSPHFISVVRAGVVSGKLTEALGHLREYLDWVEHVIGDVRQAALYPAIVLGVVACFTAFLFTFVIPKFADLLNGLHVPQPMLTKVVLLISRCAVATWWVWVPGAIIIVAAVPVSRRFFPGINQAIDRLKLRLPVFGQLNLMLALSRFSHNLAILYRSGIPILEALKQCQNGLIGNTFVEAAVGRVANDIKTGSTISEAMARQPIFSAMLIRMVGLGESTGHLDSALVTVADYYNDIIPRQIKSLFSIIEPAIMLFIIGIVGTVALAIYLPILSLMGSIR